MAEIVPIRGRGRGRGRGRRINEKDILEFDVVIQKSTVIKKDIERLKNITDGIEEAHKTFIISDNYDKLLKINSDIATTDNLAKKIRYDIESLKNMEINDINVKRQHKNMLSYLLRSFHDNLQRMIVIRETIKNKNYMEEEAKILDQTQNQIQIHAPNDRDKAQCGLIFAKEMHKDMEELEKSIVELHQLFIDLSNMVQEQQELLDIAENAIEHTTKESEKAVAILKEAEKHTNKARKKFLAVVLIVGGVCLLTIGAVAGAVTLAVFFA